MWLEQEARRRGMVGIALHVFGHNAGAKQLYEQLGFRATNINMFKSVGLPGVDCSTSDDEGLGSHRGASPAT
jgi:hypothetical protein